MRPAAQPASARASRHRRRQASHPPHSHPHATRDKSPRRPCLRRGRCARSECAAPPRRRGRGRRGSCPTHDAMLMTFAGRCCAARRSISCSACVRKNGAFRFRSTALSQPASGNSSNAAAQAAPALFTRISSWLSRSASAAARHWAPARVGTSAGSAKHEPVAASSSAVCSQAAALRDEIYTRAPCARKPAAIMRPIPRELPVTSAVRPARENRSFICAPRFH